MPAKRTTADVYVATTSGVAEVKGETMVFAKGVTRVRGGHPLLKARPDAFEPATEHIHYDMPEPKTESRG